MRVLAFLFGLVLLLPGVCSLGFMAFMIPQVFAYRASTGDIAPLSLLWAFCFLVGFGGFLMIRRAVRGQAPRSDPPAAT